MGHGIIGMKAVTRQLFISSRRNPSHFTRLTVLLLSRVSFWRLDSFPPPMATEMLTTTDRIQEAFEDLESEKTLITNCTKVWKDLSDHFSSLEQTLTDRSQSLDSKIEALDTETQQALEALDDREASIPDRESSAAALIEERKAAVISEMEDPDAKLPEDLPGILRLLCRRMDSAGVWRFLVSRRKDLSALRKEVADAVASSVDPSRLVLDAVDDFVNQLPGDGTAASAGGGDRCWALGMLLRTLFDSDRKKGQEVSESIKEKAAEVAEAMKAKLAEKGEGGGMGAPEAQLFLQLVVVFGLSSKFDQEFLKKLVLDHGTRKEIAKLVVGLEFGEKLADIIDELVKTGKEIGALYFAHESGLTERFPPIPLIKSYLQSSKKNAYTILKNGNHSSAATEESSSVELGALRSIIKCVETLNLESKFTLDGLRKRLAQLERAKSDRKKNASAKSQSKRLRGTAGGPSFRLAKAGRTSNVPYASFHRNPPASHQVPATRHPYNYIGQVGFDGPASSSFGAVHSRSPTAISQPYYVPEDMAGSRTGMPYGGASVGYGGYDYAAPHTAPAQPAYPHLSPHQH